MTTEEHILIPKSLYNDLIVYFDNRADSDGSSEGFTHNEEKRLLSRLKEGEPAPDWISVNERLPEKEDYYKVKFTDGTEDEKPFRIRPNKNIYGFMTEKTVTHWHPLPEPPKSNS